LRGCTFRGLNLAVLTAFAAGFLLFGTDLLPVERDFPVSPPDFR